MKVQMKVSISGTRDGVEWPAAGGVVDLPKAEAEHMIAASLAAPADEQKAEKAVAPAPQKAVAKKPAAKKAAAPEKR